MSAKPNVVLFFTYQQRWDCSGFRRALAICAVGAASAFLPMKAAGETREPGERVTIVADDFEVADWSFDPEEGGHGRSADGRWHGSWRGALDTVETAPTPGAPEKRSLRLALDGSSREGPPQGDLVNRALSRSGRGPLPAARRPAVEALFRLPAAREIADTSATLTAMGLRLSVVSDAREGAYYPSLIIRRTAEGSTLFARLGDGHVSDVALRELPAEGGPVRLRIAFDADGVARYYARSGTDKLEEQDLVWTSEQFETNHPSGRNPRMRRLKYHFLSLSALPAGAATPPFLVDAVRLTADPPNQP